MSLDRWIALGACIAGFISAIAALLVVRQSDLQRKLAYKPQIVLNPNIFDYRFSDEINIAERIKLKNSDNQNAFKSNIAVNIGLGAALNVKISWSHDYNELAIALNKYFEIKKKKNRLVIERHGISFLNQEGVSYAFLVTSNRDDNIDYILSYSQNPSPTEIYIPFPFINLTCMAIFYSFEAEKIMLESLPKLRVKVEYNDVGGEMYVDEYQVRVEFHHAVTHKDFIEMSGGLFFDKKRNLNQTAKVLQKLRSSYAEFIKEHNFNKHR
ncbi:hypothetical protein NFJ49_05620 [Citrobacter braakii]|uniref:hypothetical protein n=1 Tax=Citrobacter braakii TaxID=57706 RepID=UPI002433A3F9|nr:hypothetical protein [Citrobacter braakii]WFV82346.1 hypothetical protein NFJ49_05620 [Citrobacter braakii]